MVMSFATAMVNWKMTIVLYTAAFAGDMFDGMAARYFNQCMDAIKM